MNLKPLLLFLAIYLHSGTAFSQTLGLFLNDSLSVNGYTLFSNNKVTYLIDNCGFEVNRWESNYQSNSAIYLLENGNLLRSGRVSGSFSGGGIGGRIELFSWEGDLLWAYDYATADYHQHHDIEPMPNGNILILAWEARTTQEAIQEGRSANSLGSGGIWPEQIVEVEMIGTNDINIVWEWHAWDHLIQDFDLTKNNYGVVADHPELIDVNYGIPNTPFPSGIKDWIHANAIDYNPMLDQIAISSRHFSEIWIIDHGTTSTEAAGHSGGKWGKGGDLLFRWGNPEVYDRGNKTDQTLWGQHNINWILEEGHPYYGKLLVFNNGAQRPDGSYSSLDVFEPPTDQDGNYIINASDPFGPTELIWTFEQTGFFSANISGVHALSSGNFFACEGVDGRFIEVTLDGQIVWEYINPVSSNIGPLSQGQNPTQNSVFRATRYPSDYKAFEGKDLTPGNPIELNPTPTDCIIYSGQSVATSPEAMPIQAWLTNNPVRSELNIINESGMPVLAEVFDLNGRIMGSIKSSESIISINSNDWVNGIYFLRLANDDLSASAIYKFLKTY